MHTFQNNNKYLPYSKEKNIIEMCLFMTVYRNISVLQNSLLAHGLHFTWLLALEKNKAYYESNVIKPLFLNPKSSPNR